MSSKTKIEWAEASWNPTAGCSFESPGCAGCYAMKSAHRVELAMRGGKYEGTTTLVKGKPIWTGRVNLASPDTLMIPVRWRAPQVVFVDSMSDLFHADVPFDFIDKVFGIMAVASHHTYIILTKRPGRMREYILNVEDHGGAARVVAEAYVGVPPLSHAVPLDSADARAIGSRGWPLPNVWLGVSIEDQARADLRVPALLGTPASKRLLSCEPLLGRVDLSAWLHGLDWTIVGGESGRGARPMNPAWARDLRDQCTRAEVPFFFKQHGEWVDIEQIGASGWAFCHEHNGARFGRIYDSRHYPGARVAMHGGRAFETRYPFYNDGDPGPVMIRTGKKMAGAMLDGVAYTATPARI